MSKIWFCGKIHSFHTKGYQLPKTDGFCSCYRKRWMDNKKKWYEPKNNARLIITETELEKQGEIPPLVVLSTSATWEIECTKHNQMPIAFFKRRARKLCTGFLQLLCNPEWTMLQWYPVTFCKKLGTCNAIFSRAIFYKNIEFKKHNSLSFVTLLPRDEGNEGQKRTTLVSTFLISFSECQHINITGHVNLWCWCSTVRE